MGVMTPAHHHGVPSSNLQGRRLLSTVCLLTSLCFMLVGYDNGLMGGLVTSLAFKSAFDSPDEFMTGFIVAIFEVGCFFGSGLAAVFGERLGRRRSIGTGLCIMLVGAVVQAASYGRVQLIVGRVVSGLGMGIVNSTAPVLQSEFSPKLTTLNFGIFLVYWIDYAFSSRSDSVAWRVPIILQCLCILPALTLLKLIPESPRWLAARGRSLDSLHVLARMRASATDDETTLQLHEKVMQTVAMETDAGTGSWRELLRSDHFQSRKRLLIACSIQIFQQLGGINAIVYYGNTLFERSIGFTKEKAALMSGVLQTWFFIASFIPWFLIDRIGRKPLFLSMISLMAAAMAVQASLVYQVQNHPSQSRGAGIGAASMLFVFQGAFTIGFQATVWVYPSEILPLRLRQPGSSLSTASNWLCNYMIVQITPIALQTIGWRTYIIFAVLNAAWVPIIHFFFPETKGLELEDVDRLFARVYISADDPEDGYGNAVASKAFDKAA